MKTLLKRLLLVMLCISVLIGCNSNNKDDEKISIGIIQLVQHDSLDQGKDGFIDALKDNGYIDGENIKIDYQNGSNDIPTLKNISQKFVSDNKDLILAIATDAAVAIATETEDIPILVTAVTDLKEAKLVKDYNKPNTNVSGTTDMAPIEKQIDLLLEINPEVKMVGLLRSNEINSKIQIDVAKAYLDQLGIAYKEAVVTTSNDIAQVTTNLATEVDAIYIPTDNMLSAAIPTIVQITEPLNMITIGGDIEMVYEGLTASIGLDYYKLGYQTGEMAVRILKEEIKIEDLAVESLKDVDIVINKKSLDTMEISISDELLNRAKELLK